MQRHRGYEYDLVTVEGTLKVKNYKPKDVRLNIRKTLRGAVDSQSDDGETVKLPRSLYWTPSTKTKAVPPIASAIAALHQQIV